MSKQPEKKFPPMSPEEIKKDIEKQEKAELKYSLDAQAVEDALTSYLEQLDPMLWTDPKDKETKAIAWVRRPSMKQLKAMIPPEMAQYLEDPSKAPDAIQKKYEKFFYQKMEELIVLPKLNAEQWEAKANPWFIRKFWEHIGNIAKMMEGQIEGF